MKLCDIFDIAADAFEECRVEERDAILDSLDLVVAKWYWIIGPERGRAKTLQLLDQSYWRRVFSSLIANEIVSVQPMSIASGLLFYMDYRYDNSKK